MINRLNVASIYVLDKEEALDFYVNKLGLEVGNDVKQGDYRWLTVRVPGSAETEFSLEQPGPPLHDDATAAQLRDAKLRPLLDRYLRGANQTGSEERARIFRLAWDFLGSALAGRNVLYDRFYLASGARNYQIADAIASKGRALRLVDAILGKEFEAVESLPPVGGQKINLILEARR